MALIDRIRDAGIFVLAGANGELSKYSHNFLIKGYAHDFTLPIGAYFGVMAILRQEYQTTKEKSVVAALSFLLASGGEIAQYLGLFPGTFDPKDFIAYAAGSIAALGIDKLISREKKSEIKQINY